MLYLLFLSGCTRSDLFLVSTHNDEEVVVTKMNVENVSPEDFIQSELHGVVRPWRGGLAIVTASTAKPNSNVEIEWTHKNTRYSSMCSYQKVKVHAKLKCQSIRVQFIAGVAMYAFPDEFPKV